MVIKNELQNTNKVKALILDIDGTLVSFTSLEKLMNDVLYIIREEKEPQQFEKYIESVKEVLNENTIDNCFNFDNLCKKIKDKHILKDNRKASEFLFLMIKKEPQFVKAVKDANKFLELASDNKRIVCSTNWFLSSQQNKLARFDMLKHIKTIYTCEDLLSKPSIEHFRTILKEENLSPEEAIMIGDSITDIPPKELGLQSIILFSQYQKKAIYENATCVITELMDIPRLLKFKTPKQKIK